MSAARKRAPGRRNLSRPTMRSASILDAADNILVRDSRPATVAPTRMYSTTSTAYQATKDDLFLKAAGKVQNHSF